MAASSPKCELFPGIYGAFMQFFLLGMTLLVLVGKNHFERKSGVNNRKCQEFFLDMLKQLAGFGIVHVANFRSVVLQTTPQGDPCRNYLLEILMDTTVGIFVQWAFFKLIWLCISRGLEEQYSKPFRRGQYYVDGVLQLSHFYKQLAMWCACSILMKMAMLSLIQLFDGFLKPIVQILLSPLKGYPNFELFLIMVVVPTVMNTLQLWVQDNFLQASNSNAPSSANTFDPWFFLAALAPERESKYREHLKPLLPLFAVCDSPPMQKGKGKGKPPCGPAPPGGKGPGKAPGKGADTSTGKGADEARLPFPGPRPAAELKTRKNLKLHWKPIAPDEHKGANIWSKIRNQTTRDMVPELPAEVLEQAFMERRQSGRKGKGKGGSADEHPDDKPKFKRNIKVHLIKDTKEAFHMEIAYNQLDQKGMTDPKVLDGSLGRRNTDSSLSWPEVLDHEKLEAILKFIDQAVKYESVLTHDAVTETQFEKFILALVIHCGALSTMKRRAEALLAKGRLQVLMDDLTDQYARIQDNVHHIIHTSTKLPELLQYALQLGNYINHGTNVGNAEAVELNSLVSAMTRAKCSAKPGDREMTILKFLAKMLRKTRDEFWLGQLKRDLCLCCEARHVDPAAFSQQIKACRVDLQVIETFAETAGEEDPPELSPDALKTFIAATSKGIDDLDIKKLDQDRKQLLTYLALPDTEETTVPLVLECIAALHDELFGGQLHTTSTFKVGSKFVKEETSSLNVDDWLKEHKFTGVNDARIFFNPLATWQYPLHVAVMQKMPKVVKLLLEAQADPTKTNLTASARELTPLRLANYYESSFNFTSRANKGAYTDVIKILEDAEAAEIENSTWS